MEQQLWGIALALTFVFLGSFSVLALRSEHSTVVHRAFSFAWAFAAFDALLQLASNFTDPSQRGGTWANALTTGSVIFRLLYQASAAHAFLLWWREGLIATAGPRSEVYKRRFTYAFFFLWGATAILAFRALQSRLDTDPLWFALVSFGLVLPWIVFIPVTIVLALRSKPNLVRKQASIFLAALALGYFPDSLCAVGLSSFFSWPWMMGIPIWGAVGAFFSLRALKTQPQIWEGRAATAFLLEKTRDAVVFVNPNGLVHATNPALKNLLEWDENRIVGKPLSSLSSSEYDIVSLRELEQLSLSDWEGIVGLTHRRGDTIPVRLVYRRIYNPQREVVGAVILLHDLRTPEEANSLTREDLLTTLANRRWVLELLETEFQRLKRYGGQLSVLWIDVDGLSKINLSYGLTAGDEVLRRIGRILKESVRKTDFIGRIGGEEFLVVLPETALSKATLVAEKLLKTISLTPFHRGEEVFSVTAGIGIVTADLIVDSTEEFLMQAETAVVEAKKLGRGKLFAVAH